MTGNRRRRGGQEPRPGVDEKKTVRDALSDVAEALGVNLDQIDKLSDILDLFDNKIDELEKKAWAADEAEDGLFEQEMDLSDRLDDGNYADDTEKAALEAELEGLRAKQKEHKEQSDKFQKAADELRKSSDGLREQEKVKNSEMITYLEHIGALLALLPPDYELGVEDD